MNAFYLNHFIRILSWRGNFVAIFLRAHCVALSSITFIRTYFGANMVLTFRNVFCAAYEKMPMSKPSEYCDLSL